MMNSNGFSKRIMAGAVCLGSLALVTGSVTAVWAAPSENSRLDKDQEDKGRLSRERDRDRRDDKNAPRSSDQDDKGRLRRDDDKNNRRDDDRDDKGRLRQDDRNRPGWGRGPADPNRRNDDRWDNNRRNDGRWDNGRWDDRRRDDDRWGNDRWGDNSGWGYGGYRGTATWSDIDRRPSIDWNSPAGFYVWRDRDDIYIVANDRDRGRRSRYSGEIMIQNGRLSRVDGFDTESSDQVQQTDDNRARFEFDTNDDRDGMKFHVDDGSRIVITLRGDGGNGDRIYLGRDRIPSRSNPLVISR